MMEAHEEFNRRLEAFVEPLLTGQGKRRGRRRSA
jgi:hypothetical protein